MAPRHPAPPASRDRTTAGILRPAGLPAPLSDLIGRDAAAVTVSELLTRRRLVTLTGPGGVGKTQLALAVAHRLAEHFSGEIAFVALAAIADPQLVVPTIASALGVQGAGIEPLGERLKALIGQQHILLVLDNVEHLLAAAPEIADLLAACAHLHLLVTSRSALRVRGEYLFDVLPLEVPPRQPGLTRAEVARFPAVEMLVSRAQASDATFALTDANAETISAICAKLDGLPLAIDLAAPRFTVLTPDGVLARLNEQIPFLTGGPRDQPLRLQTMRSAIAWSYDLLDAGQRAFFRRLTVFSGGWTLAAAAAVCMPDEDVLEEVSALIGFSLVRRVPQHDGEARYAMLEPIRQFALEQLELSGESHAVRSRHADVYLALVEQAAPHLNWSDQREWLLRLDHEYDNCRGAIAWLLTHGDAARGLRFSAALSWFWNMRGLFSEGLTTVQAFLDLPQTAGQSAERARALGTLAHLRYFIGDNEAAREVGDEALELIDQTNDSLSYMRILISLSVIAFDVGDDERHDLLANELLLTARSHGDQANIARALARLGHSALRRGDLVQAALLLDESLALARRLENPNTTALALGILGDLHCRSGAFERAAPAYRDSLSTYVELDYRRPIAQGLERIASLACACLQFQRAAQLYAAAAEQRAAIGSNPSQIERRVHENDRTSIRAGLSDMQFQAAWERGRAMTAAEAVAYALETHPQPNITHPVALAGLTPREHDVLRLIAAGQSNKQIAAELFLSIRTVERHITNLYTKIGAHGKADATAWALRHGLA